MRNFKEIKQEIENGIEFTTTTIDIRPSRWRHPILRLNWWRRDKREARRRKKLSPLEREVEDSLRRGIDNAILFGEGEVDIETIKITDPEYDAKQKAKLYGEWSPGEDDEPLFPMPKMDYPSDSFRKGKR